MDAQTKKIIVDLINHAESGQKVPFRLLRTWREYRITKNDYKRTKVIIKNLYYINNLLFKRYRDGIPEHTAPFTNLLACQTLQGAIDFYKGELKTLSSIIEEYECYLLLGNFLDFIFYGKRPEHKLKDYRSWSIL